MTGIFFHEPDQAQTDAADGELKRASLMPPITVPGECLQSVHDAACMDAGLHPAARNYLYWPTGNPPRPDFVVTAVTSPNSDRDEGATAPCATRTSTRLKSPKTCANALPSEACLTRKLHAGLEDVKIQPQILG